MGRPDGAKAEPSVHDMPDSVIDGDAEERCRQAREADKWIADRLRQTNYDLGHPQAQQLADHLQHLGIGTLITLKNQGSLFTKCRSLTNGVMPDPPPSWNTESQRVIVVAVRMAIPDFITKSMRTWDSSQSSIKTYFVNYCLFKFKTAYAQYCREEAQTTTERPSSNVVELVANRAAADDVESVAVAQATLREMTTTIGTHEFAEYVKHALSGQTQSQCADALGISESTLNRRISEWRRTLRQGDWFVSSGRRRP